MNVRKINPEVIALWSRVLEAVPDSRLLLVRSDFESAALRERFMQSFAAHGIAPERIECRPQRADSKRTFLATYQQFDISLDTFPYAGHTTTCEALWMGVPVVTLAGEAFIARVGVSLLTHAGFPEWIAPDSDAYVAIARDLAADRDRLAALRADMRERVRTSPLLDAAGFTRCLEAAYRELWRRWCAGAAPLGDEGPPRRG